MKTHDTYLALAAAALDFGLSPAERTRLNAHLADCQLCARSAAAMRADALVLAGLPRLTLPERRSAELLYAAMHPATVRHPLRLVAVAALLALLALGSLVVGAELLRRMDEDRSVVLPPATATPAPDASGPSEPDASPIPLGRLAVTRGDESGNGGTWVELVTLETGATGPLGFGADPAWFRDGRLVYACAKALGENTTICMVDPTQELQPEIASGATMPAPAPDGGLIAVHRGAIDVGETWLLRPDGQDLHRLTAGSFLEWSPDGAWLVGQPGSATFEVAVVRADGSDGGPHVLAAGYDPAWSPAGDRIAYAVVDAQGANVRVMTPFTDVSETRYTAPATSELSAPMWLPDGRLVFVLDGDLYRLDAGSSEPVRLTTGLTIPGDAIGDVLSVSPDGRWIAFTNGSGMASRVGIAPVDGDGWEMLELGAGPVSQPRWDPVPPGESASNLEPGVSPQPGEPGAGGPPGAYWIEATPPAVEVDRPVGQITAVTAGSTGFVAVGSGCLIEVEPMRCEAVIWTSPDGRAWERAPASEATTLTASFPTSGPEIGMFDVAPGSPAVVAIGYAALPTIRAVTWFSPDGVSWERQPLGDPSSTRVNAVTWDGGQFVAVGEDRSGVVDGQSLGTAKARAAVWTSPDGRAWTAVPPTDALDVGGFIDTMEDPASGGMRDVVVGPGGLVAVGSMCQAEPKDCQPAAWTSADGTAWVRAAGMPDLSGILKAVAVSDDGYVAVGAETCDSSPVAVPGGCLALVLTSPDGVAWTQQSFEQAGDLRTVAAVGERLFATAPDGPVVLWVSDDGSAWAAAEVEGGPVAPSGGAITGWHLASTRDVAVWLGPTRTEFDAASDPLAWVSDGNVP